MTYREALRESFVALLLSWRRLPVYGREILDELGDALRALGVALLLLLGPVLALLAPLWAFLVLADERKRAKQQADERKFAERFNRHQRVDRDVG
ncbi:hypothetical protein [Bordetella phage vB_BbrM_PHB04]|uniref:Uncharacterized protein n=1 Tax=Bordetella phage vB_BbrM_PHB04 TaxID=2029657 RepID=A0A291LAP4_9CAUD|nr:hypothetical protein HOS14_gp060 [Bordetella phage vB_BbrM_PHB04]ATI15678.1 hypothetical protein [Bordetella phage vB_BbrM_PHB04]